LPFGDSSPLFTLSLGVFDFGDSAATSIADLNYLGLTAAGCQLKVAPDDPCNFITDSLGKRGLPNVLADLLTNFGLLENGDYGFLRSYSITMDVPGDATNSLLFLNEVAGTEAQAAAPVRNPRRSACSGWRLSACCATERVKFVVLDDIR